MIAILWVKVLIFQGAKPIFNVGSLSFLYKRQEEQMYDVRGTMWEMILGVLGYYFLYQCIGYLQIEE